MRHSIVAALTEHQMQMDENIKSAVDEYCTPENLKRVVDSAAASALNNVIKEEVTKFFLYGDGRSAVAESVRKSILSNKTYTGLDNV